MWSVHFFVALCFRPSKRIIIVLQQQKNGSSTHGSIGCPSPFVVDKKKPNKIKSRILYLIRLYLNQIPFNAHSVICHSISNIETNRMAENFFHLNIPVWRKKNKLKICCSILEIHSLKFKSNRLPAYRNPTWLGHCRWVQKKFEFLRIRGL